jgi:signal peptidase
VHRRSDPDDDEPSDDEEEDDKKTDEPTPKRRTRRPSRAPPKPLSAPPEPIRRWKSKEGATDEDETSLEDARERAHRPRSAYWRFRDSFLFVPILAVLIVVLILGGLLAYTQTWPPIYVVESSSMQHGPNDVVGVINAGDLILSQKTSLAGIVTYVGAISTGYRTYGEYGDVLLYQPNGAAGTPIIHRALIYLDYNPLNSTYNASSLAGLPCGTSPNDFYNVLTSAHACGPYGMTGTLTLYGIGWQGATVPIDLGPTTLGTHSGYVTLGDDNFETPDCSGSACIGEVDQNPSFKLSQLVTPAWTVGVARGMVPWFGGLRLLLTGSAGEVPAQSWELMALTVVAVILAAFALHYAWKSLRPPDRRRAAVETRRESEEEAEEEEEEKETPRRRWFHRRARGEDEDDGGSTRTSSSRPGRKSTGRPSPSVRRPTDSSRDRKRSDERGDEL